MSLQCYFQNKKEFIQEELEEKKVKETMFLRFGAHKVQGNVSVQAIGEILKILEVRNLCNFFENHDLKCIHWHSESKE